MLKSPISNLVASGNLDNFQKYAKTEGNIKFIVERDSLLHVACKYGHLNIVKELLKLGADCSYKHPSNQRIPLHDACIIGNEELVELMTEKSLANIDTADKNGLTPAHVCAMEGELNCLKILKDHGASFSIGDKDGMRLIHWAAKRNHPSIIYYLFGIETNINEKCSNGKTALHYAAMNNSVAATQSLIKCQADITIGDNDEATAMHMAAKYGSIECLRFLAAQGIPVNMKQSNGKTPGHLAALQGFYECLHWLFDNGADIQSLDDNGNTIGHNACQGGHAQTINCFLSHKGSTEVKNKLEENLYQTARRYGHPVKFEMAKNNETVCPICQLEANKGKWDQIHASPAVVKLINNSHKTLFQNPLGSYSSTIKNHQKAYCDKKTEINRKNLETINIGKISSQKRQQKPQDKRIGGAGYRDLITRYYGEHIHNL